MREGGGREEALVRGRPARGSIAARIRLARLKLESQSQEWQDPAQISRRFAALSHCNPTSFPMDYSGE